jgi:branched-chain amino acid transport system permease protein
MSVLVIAGLASVVFWGSSFTMRTLVEFLSLLALAQMWNLLAGYAGLVSIGQQAWIGLGGYALFVLADDLKLNLFVSVFLAGIIVALCAVPTAFLVFRLRAGYFAVGMWVVAEVLRLLVSSSTDWLKGGSGRTLNAAKNFPRPVREDLTFIVAVIVGIGAVALVYFLMRSKTGLGLTALRDSEKAAASLGMNTYWLKFFIFVLAAAITGIVGALIYLNVLNIRPNAAFSVQWTAFMVFIVVIGGIGTIEGPIIGTLVFFLIREYLSGLGEWSFVILGVIAVGMMLLAPQGLWGLISRKKFELFPVRRRFPQRVLSRFKGGL